ncbi:MAG: hypothetical protein WCC42_30100, partial [Pseudolabrys sp.]
IDRVNRYMLRRLCPPEEATHGVEVIAGLRWRMSATVFACNDDGLGDCSVGLVACRLNDLFKVVFPIASGRWR